MKNVINIKDIDKKMIEIINELKPFKGKLYLVGGAIRDIIGGVKPDDYDILTDCSLEEIIRKLRHKHKIRTAHIENRVNPLIRLNIDNSLIVDLSFLREELKFNLISRDFTVNSLAINLNELIRMKETKIIDYFRGVEHATERTLFPTSNNSLNNDPLRILRAFRLKLYKNYSLSDTLLKDIDRFKESLSEVKGERIWMELEKILSHKNSYTVFSEIIRREILDSLIPEIAMMRTFSHNKPPAKTLLEHSLFSYMKIESFIEKDVNKIWPEPEYFSVPIMKLATFLHDIGKLYTKRFTGENEFHFYNHEIIGAKKASNIVKNKLSFSNVNVKYTNVLVANHMRPHLFTRIPKLTDHAIYRFIRDCDGHPEDVITVSIADALSTNSRITKLAYVAQQVNDYIKRNSKNEIVPLVDGNEIMSTLLLKPSKEVGEIKKDIIEQQTNGLINTKTEAIAYLKKKYGKTV